MVTPKLVYKKDCHQKKNTPVWSYSKNKNKEYYKECKIKRHQPYMDEGRKLVDTIIDILLLFLRRGRSDSEEGKDSKEGEGLGEY